VQADVELREVEAEELDAASQCAEPAVGQARAAVLPEAAIDELEVGGKLVRAAISPRAARERLAEAVPDEGELAPVGLVRVLAPDLPGIGGQLALVSGERLDELDGHADERARDPERRGELANFASVPRQREPPGPVERLADRRRAGRGVAVLIAADPGPEAQRLVRVRQVPAEVSDEERGSVQKALLEEPQAVPDLVDDARPLRPHLVGLPQPCDLLGQ
jgi:hypothetical protein